MSFSSAARRALRPVGTMAAAFALASCSNKILAVDTPDVLSDNALGGSLGATTLRNGSLQDFVVAFSGATDGFVVSTGNMADEIQTTDTFADRYFTDERKQNEVLGGATNTMYNGLHLARAGMTSAIAAWTKSKTSTATAVKDTLAEMYAIRGYAENLFGEAYCSGVPFSATAADGSFIYGKPLTTAQMFATAGSSLDSAATLATGAAFKNLAAVGKARVLLNQGQFAQAAAAVSAVPTSFKYQVFHSVATGRQQNGVYNATFTAGTRYTVGTKEGTNGLDFLTTPADPRVPWTASSRVGFDGTSRNLPVEQKYPGQNTAVTLADGIEARLIEAEARLNATSGGSQADRDAVFAQLNVLRATGLATAIAPLAAAPTTQAAAVDMLFKERAFWMWLTGHRLGDLRRLIRQYGRTQDAVFPIGNVVYRPGESYGSDVNFVVPFAERNNPNFTGCIDRNP
jgi:starch-binding outer membrane protein, SusD/RagB family